MSDVELTLEHPSEGGGDWCTITQKKTKKKKRNKPVPLKDFFTSDEKPSSGHHVQTELIRTSGGIRDSSLSANLPELTADEMVIAASLRTYFADLLTRLGPVRPDNMKLKGEINNLDESGQRLISRFSNFSVFLAVSEDIQVIDNYLCHKGDCLKAKNLAIDTILNNVNVNKSPTLKSNIQSHPPTLPPNPWTKLGNSSSELFGSQIYNQNHQQQNQKNQPDTSQPPPPIQKPHTSMFSASLPSGMKQGFGDIGSPLDQSRMRSGSLRGNESESVVYQQQQQLSLVESLNTRLNGLANCNSDLLLQLQEKEKQIFKFKQMVTGLEEKAKSHDKLKADYVSAQRELFKLKSDLKVDQPQPDGSTANHNDAAEGGTLTENQLIISLQKQLESEKVNSRSLKHQLQTERTFSAKLAEKLKSMNNSNPSIGGLQGLQSLLNGNSSGSLIGSDSLGLKGLLSVASSSGVGGFNQSSSGIGSIRPVGGSFSSFANLSLGSLTQPPPQSNSSFSSHLATPQSNTMLSTSSMSGSGGVGRGSFVNTNQNFLQELKLHFPGLTIYELETYLSRLRSKCGHLNGLSVSKLAEMLRIIIDTDRSVFRSSIS